MTKLDPNAQGGGYVGRNHPPTSKAAATVVRAGTQEAFLLELMCAAGTNGLTCWEATQDAGWRKVRPHIAENQVAARMLSLREKGLVKRLKKEGAYVTRPTPTSEAIVHVITANGFTEAANLILARSGRP